jgi:putative phosphoribosyl transferase
VISRRAATHGRVFADRDEAGRVLADLMVRQADTRPEPTDAHPQPATADTRPAAPDARPLVLALPRGGVPVAAPVAAGLGADLDIVVARKIGAPGQPELGVGAIAADGPPVFHPAALRALGLREADLAGTVAAERAELLRRIRRYRGNRPAPSATDRLVVVVDDGLATGITALAALRWLRTQHPRRLVVAAPVCSGQARATLDGAADAIACLHVPKRFRAVGQWYADFRQLTDEDVTRMLAARHVP